MYTDTEKAQRRYREGTEKVQRRYREGTEKVQRRYREDTEKIQRRYRAEDTEKIQRRHREDTEKTQRRYISLYLESPTPPPKAWAACEFSCRKEKFDAGFPKIYGGRLNERLHTGP